MMRRNSQKMFLGIEIEGWKQVQWWTEIPVFILFQVLIAVPLIGFVSQNIHQYPSHIYPLLYVMVLLIPPVGIVADVCIFYFIHRPFRAFGVFLLCSFGSIPAVLLLPTPYRLLAVLCWAGMMAGLRPSMFFLGLLIMRKQSRMSEEQLQQYWNRVKAEQEVEKAKEPARDNIALVFITTIGLGFVIMFSSVFPIYIYGKSFDVGTLMHPAALVTAGMMLVSVIAKRVLKIHPAIMFVLLGVAVVAVVIWVGFPGCMVIIPGLVGYWTAEAWFLAASGWAASIRERIAMQIIKVRHDK